MVDIIDEVDERVSLNEGDDLDEENEPDGEMKSMQAKVGW